MSVRNVLGHSAALLWHKEPSLGDADAVIVPGGFSYGDYLRTRRHCAVQPGDGGGASVRRRRRAGAGHLQRVPDSLRGRAAARGADSQSLAPIPLRAHLPEDRHGRFAVHEPDSAGQTPAPAHRPRRRLLLRRRGNAGQAQGEQPDPLALRGCAAAKPTEAANPNGSLDNIAGICNEQRNVAGLMPHPERASEPMLGCADGRLVFESMIHALASKPVASDVSVAGRASLYLQTLL